MIFKFCYNFQTVELEVPDEAITTEEFKNQLPIMLDVLKTADKYLGPQMSVKGNKPVTPVEQVVEPLATEAQRNYMTSLRIPWDAQTTKKQAHDLIQAKRDAMDTEREVREQGLPF